MSDLERLVLHDLHVELGGKMVPFAGYEMPVQYGLGVMKEHLHTRSKAGLFDVSHMGQVLLRPKGSYEATALAFEALMPVDVLGVAPGRQRYGLFTNAEGGILDDLMFANRGDHLFVVVNAACKAQDIAHMTAHLSDTTEVIPVTDRALFALQGPAAEAALDRVAPGAAAMRFMDVAVLDSAFGALWVSRSGYTGEDGYEVSVENGQAEALARALLAMEEVEAIGLGARDSLRLEAGLCLYGHDIDTTTTPVEAGLTWAIQKVRRTGGARAGGFPGAGVVLAQINHPASLTRKRVGLIAKERVPVREGTALQTEDGQAIGSITSGLLAPSVDRPIALGYVTPEYAQPGTRLVALVRGKAVPMEVAPTPFLPPRYHRG